VTRIALLAALALACSAPFAPPAGVAIEPPAEWRAAWVAAEACLGITGDFSAIDWRVASGPLLDADGVALEAQWWPSGTVYVTAAVADAQSPLAPWYRARVITHEAIHALLQTHHHPQAFAACGVR
jgi:hypothetical protein